MNSFSSKIFQRESDSSEASINVNNWTNEINSFLLSFLFTNDNHRTVTVRRLSFSASNFYDCSTCSPFNNSQTSLDNFLKAKIDLSDADTEPATSLPLTQVKRPKSKQNSQIKKKPKTILDKFLFNNSSTFSSQKYDHTWKCSKCNFTLEISDPLIIQEHQDYHFALDISKE